MKITLITVFTANPICRIAEEETADYADERKFEKSGGNLQ